MRLEENKVYYYDETRQFTADDIIQNGDILLHILSHARNGFIYYRRFDISTTFYKYRQRDDSIDFKLLSYTDNDSTRDI